MRPRCRNSALALVGASRRPASQPASERERSARQTDRGWQAGGRALGRADGQPAGRPGSTGCLDKQFGTVKHASKACASALPSFHLLQRAASPLPEATTLEFGAASGGGFPVAQPGSQVAWQPGSGGTRRLQLHGYADCPKHVRARIYLWKGTASNTSAETCMDST